MPYNPMRRLARRSHLGSSSRIRASRAGESLR